MKREVLRYMTADGQLHNSEQQADRHAENLLGRKLDGFIEFAFPDAGHQPAKSKAAHHLYDNRQQTIAMLRELLHVLTYGEGDE